MKREVQECQASRISKSIFGLAKGGTRTTFLERLIPPGRNIDMSLRNFKRSRNFLYFLRLTFILVDVLINEAFII